MKILREKINILGINIDKVDLVEAVKLVTDFIESRQYGKLVVTPNPEMVMKARSDPELKQILNRADVKVADGIGLVLAARILQKPLHCRVPGYELMQELLKKAAANNYSVYFLGAEPGIAGKAAARIKQKYPRIDISGCHHGFLKADEEQQQVVFAINKLQPELLFVGMGVPLQEKFLDRHLPHLKVNVAMTVGGSFDVIAGNKKRAPDWMQRCYLEWFYRLLQDPSRWRRTLILPFFVFNVLLSALSKE